MVVAMVVNDGEAPLRTVDRALQILLCFDATRSEWGVSDLARELGWDKSVTQRLLATLTHRQFLRSDPQTHRYRLGPSAYRLGHFAARDNPFAPIVRPFLHAVAQQGGETALFTVPDGDEAHCLAAVDGPSPVRYSTQVGGHVPGHAGAGGKVLFAWRPEAEQRALFGERTLARYTDTTITDVERLIDEFAHIRDMGVSTSDGEIDRDVAAVSVPVFSGGDVLGAISAVGPLPRVQRERSHLIELLRAAADDVSRHLSDPGRPGVAHRTP